MGSECLKSSSCRTKVPWTSAIPMKKISGRVNSLQSILQQTIHWSDFHWPESLALPASRGSSHHGFKPPCSAGLLVQKRSGNMPFDEWHHESPLQAPWHLKPFSFHINDEMQRVEPQKLARKPRKSMEKRFKTQWSAKVELCSSNSSRSTLLAFWIKQTTSEITLKPFKHKSIHRKNVPLSIVPSSKSAACASDMLSAPQYEAGKSPSSSAPLESQANLPNIIVCSTERHCSATFLAMCATPGLSKKDCKKNWKSSDTSKDLYI